MQVLFVGVDQNDIQLKEDHTLQPLFAEDIEEAIRFLFHIDIDAVVLDLSSTSEPATEAAVRSLRHKTDLPVVALVVDAEQGSRALTAGVQDFILKDLVREDLLTRVLRYSVQLQQTAKAVTALSGEVERLKDYDNPFRSFFIRSPVGMVVMDPGGRLVRVNRALQNMLGCSAAELLNQPLSMFIHPDDSLDYIERLAALQEGRIGFFETENRFYRKNGEIAWWRVTLSYLKEKKGSARLIFGLVKDVSNWKKSEVDLQKAKELAEAMAKTKTEFLANMSHEIRTPIHTITGMTELLLETHLDMEQVEYARQISFSADVLLNLVSDILDYSKIEAGKLNLEQIDFDLYELLESAVDLVILEAHKKNLEVILEMASDVPHRLRGDPARLRQIVVNLFNNAVKFTQQGEIHISVTETRRSASRSTLKFTVRDTGIGISGEKLPGLFLSFSQADSSTTRKYGGTGLGLSISKSLAEMMGGSIGVDSEQGVGSTFWFTAVLRRQAKENLFRDVPGDFYDDLTILLIDDNASARGVLKGYLEAWGCAVEEAANGEQGLEKLRERGAAGNPYAFALVDLRLPGIDGWHVASEIHADRRSDTKLILMTPQGMGSGEAKMKLLRWFDGYLSKPVKKGQLLAEIFRVFASDFEIELAELEAAEETVEEVEVQPAAAEAAAGSILVVEDHEVNQQLFKAILERMGFQVLIAEDGLKALEAVREATFDLIFMDIQMPNLNGYDATRQLRKMGVRTPIVAVTASALKEEQKRALAAGMNGCLTKPFKKKDVLAVLTRWLRPTSGYQSSGSENLAEAPAVGAFDFSKAVAAFMGREEVVRGVLGSFLEKLEDRLSAMIEAFDNGDMEWISREAHAIKGGAWNLEARSLGEAARSLEEAAGAGEAGKAGRALRRLQSESERFKKAVLPCLERGEGNAV